VRSTSTVTSPAPVGRSASMSFARLNMLNDPSVMSAPRQVDEALALSAVHRPAPEVAPARAYLGNSLRGISVSGNKSLWLAANLQPDMDVCVGTAHAAWQMMPTNDQSHATSVRRWPPRTRGPRTSGRAAPRADARLCG
jgi:hypothetical protein